MRENKKRMGGRITRRSRHLNTVLPSSGRVNRQVQVSDQSLSDISFLDIIERPRSIRAILLCPWAIFIVGRTRIGYKYAGKQLAKV